MRLTLLRAKEALRPFAPADKLEYRLNRVCERYCSSEKYAGSMKRIVIRAPFGAVALPREFRAINGVRACNRGLLVANHWYDYLPGRFDIRSFNVDFLRDLDDGHAIMQDIPIGGVNFTTAPGIGVSLGGGTGAQIQAVIEHGRIVRLDVVNQGSGYTSAPSLSLGMTDLAARATIYGDKVVTAEMIPSGHLAVSGASDLTVYGVDLDNMPVVVTVPANTSTTPNTFARIDRVHKEEGAASVTLSHVYDGYHTTLATLAPKQEEAFYHRYQYDTLINRADGAVQALVKIRHIEFTDENDVLPISNISALENGLNALQFEAEHDTTSAGTYWNIGYKILNDELRDTRGDNTTPGIRFVYPGRTAPRFRMIT